MNILKRADEIMNARSEEKDREYGPFVESIKRASVIATEMCGINITPEIFCKCLIALKLGRLRYNIKDDTLLDAVAYIDGLQKIRDSQYCKFSLDPTDWESYAKTKGKDEENE